MVYMKQNIRKLSTIAIFSSIIIVLQIIATFIKIGSFPITLTLIPIIIGGAIYGPLTGLLLGLVFGTIVDVMVITGLDAGGTTMMAIHPFITIVACLIKGGLCGLLGSLAYKYIPNNKTGIIVDSIVTPIINTATLYISLILFFDSSLSAMLAAFMSINFIIELAINILVAPGLTSLIKRQKERIK